VRRWRRTSRTSPTAFARAHLVRIPHVRTEQGLLRVVGPWDLIGQGINLVLASSVFVLPGITLAALGGWAPLSVTLAAIGTLFVLLTFGDAAGRYREPGGPYRYAGDAFGEYVGTQIGMVYWVQRKRYWTMKRFWKDLAGGQPVPIPTVGEVLERKLRKRVFRMGPPGFIERMQYRLDRDGVYDPDLPPPDPALLRHHAKLFASR